MMKCTANLSKMQPSIRPLNVLGLIKSECTMRTSVLLLIAPLVAALAGSACVIPDDDDCPYDPDIAEDGTDDVSDADPEDLGLDAETDADEPDAITSPTTACETDLDCPAVDSASCETACLEGVCHAFCDDTCWRDRPCPDSEACVQGVCEDCGCGDEDAPVCGEHGETFKNACLADCNGEQIVHDGACEIASGCVEDAECAAGVELPAHCSAWCSDGGCAMGCSDACSESHPCDDGICDGGVCVPDPCECEPTGDVCGADGVTYTSPCAAECADVELMGLESCEELACDSDATCDTRTTCRDGFCQPCGCTEGPPVCGDDGVTYAGECAATCAGTSVAYERACTTECVVHDECGPGLACEDGSCTDCGCPYTYDPVCARVLLDEVVTVQSACEASCRGLDSWIPGSCEGTVCDTADDCTWGQLCNRAGECANLTCPDEGARYWSRSPAWCSRNAVHRSCDPGEAFFDDGCGCGCVEAEPADCGCGTRVVPVCSEGRTYDSSCLAECAGVQTWQSGVCCSRGFIDLDGLSGNGCEYICTTVGDTDLATVPGDSNCDGVDGVANGGVFVAPAPFGALGASGTRTEPVLTIAEGIALASEHSLGAVFVSAGGYPERITLANGISIYGGYLVEDNTYWRRHPGAITTVGTTEIGIMANGIDTLTQVDGLTIVTRPMAAGESARAITIINSTSELVFSNNIIAPSHGGHGANGANGDDGAPGGDGGTGQSGGTTGDFPHTQTRGGTGGTGGETHCGGMFDDHFAGNGGAGYHGAGEVFGTAGLFHQGFDGYAGGNTGLPASGGWAGESMSSDGGDCVFGGCHPVVSGTPGQPGEDGREGATAFEFPSPDPHVIGHQPYALTSTPGLDGQQGGGGGGGGGGSDTECCSDRGGGGGGGGGAGSCGGRGGAAGQPGGASIAILMVSSEAQFRDNLILMGDGGDGGMGGHGGLGGVPGEAGSAGWSIPGHPGHWGPNGAGGAGGSGGRGGNGGCGLPGVGGSSIALLNATADGVIPLDTLVDNEIILGSAGQGGTTSEAQRERSPGSGDWSSPCPEYEAPSGHSVQVFSVISDIE